MNSEKNYVVEKKTDTTYKLSRTSSYETPFIFRVEEEGQYMLRASLSYKEKSFINSGQTVS